MRVLVYVSRGSSTTDCEGVASLVAQPTAGALKSLELLDLDGNQITDAGCATLVAALRGGALPALKDLELVDNPAASQQARGAVQAALAARRESALVMTTKGASVTRHPSPHTRWSPSARSEELQ